MGLFNLRQNIVMVTVIGQTGLSRNLLGRKKVFALHEEAGDLPLNWLGNQVAEQARQALASGLFKLVNLHNPVRPEEKATVMIEPYLPPCDLIILGGGHIALPLAAAGQLLGYHVTVVDDRPEFISAERIPAADKGVFCSFDHIEEHLDFGPRSSVVIVVIPRSTTLLVVVIGADVIGRALNSNFMHRPAVISRMIGLKPGSIVDPENIARLIIHPQGVLRSCPPGARIIPFINKADCLENRDGAYRLASYLLGGRIRSVILGSAISKDPVFDVID